MFTGLIQKIGTLDRVTRRGASGQIAVWADFPAPQIGESIAVNGVCLTLVQAAPRHLTFELLHETLQRTALADKASGARLHLERALRMGDALGGHYVSGHIDGTARVEALTLAGRDHILTLHAPDLLAGIVFKGSVAIDGVSLTVAQLDAAHGTFCVHLIPHTWENTAFDGLRSGDHVNIETDLLGKYARPTSRPAEDSPVPSSPITMERLKQSGFL